MAYHLAAFYSSLDAAGAFTPVVPIADPMLFVQGNAIRVPTDMPNLIWMAGGADATVSPQFRFTSPSLTTVGRPQIQPVNVTAAAAALPGSPFNIMWVDQNPIALAGDELLTCDLLNNPAAAQYQWAMIQFGDAVPTPIINGKIVHHRATSATAAVANAWTNTVITFDDALQPGTYAVVGLRAMSTTMVAARMVFNNDPAHRPGVLGCQTAGGYGDQKFRDGRSGLMGTFPFTQTPTIDVLCNAADAANTMAFELDLIQIG